MLHQYTRSELQTLNRNQLWELCRERGLKCFPKSVDCVEAIFSSQRSVEKIADAEVVADEQTVAQPELVAHVESQVVADPEENFPQGKTGTCVTCPLFKPFNDGTGRGLCCGVPDTSLVVRDHHRQTGDCLHLIEEQEVSENPIPGYSFCISRSIEFKQRTGSETGTTYWYAVAPHYYGQTNRQYKTGSFEKLENAVKAALDYLGKCGVDVVEIKQQLIDRLRYGIQVELGTIQNQSPIKQKLPTLAIGDFVFYRVCTDDFTHQIALNDDELNLVWCAALITKIYPKTVDIEFKLPDREGIFAAKKVKISNLKKNVIDSYSVAVYDGYKEDSGVTQTLEEVRAAQTFQSGELFFIPIADSCAKSAGQNLRGSELCATYTVKRWDVVVGEIFMNTDIMWEAVGLDALYPTPYQAAAALLEAHKKADSNAVVSPAVVEILSNPLTEYEHNPSFDRCQKPEIPEIEIDSTPDPDFGDLYRVWSDMKLLGTFYQGVADKKWIAQLTDEQERYYCDTEFEAQLLIVAKSGLLVADSLDDVDNLLDKPIDELSIEEWQQIKQYYRSIELQAA